MKKSFLAVLLILICLGIDVLASEKVLLDNKKVNEYRGKTGQWKKITSRSRLNYYIKQFRSTMSEVKIINEKISYNRYIFIPFSREYLSSIRKEGLARAVKKSVEREQFIWPVLKVDRISSSFGIRWGEMHPGVDLPVPKGTPILAARDGRITLSKYISGYGKTIIIEHRNSYITKYAHNSILLVKDGDFVKKGQIVAYSGSTGNSTGSHLHFEIRFKNIPLNPIDFLPELKHLYKK